MKRRKQRNIIKHITPGKEWSEALISGSGENIMMVLGGVNKERIRLYNANLLLLNTDDKLYNISDELKDVVENLKRGNIEYKKINNAIKKYSSYNIDKNFCEIDDIFLNFRISSPCWNYYRAVDMESREIEVSYFDSQGKVTRDYIYSKERNICAMKFYCNEKKHFLNCECGLLKTDSITIFDKNFMISKQERNGLTYGCIMRVCIHGGDLCNTRNSFVINSCESFEIFAKTFVISSEEDYEKTIRNIKKELNQINDYDTLPYENKKTSDFYSGLSLEIFCHDTYSVEESLLESQKFKLSISLIEKLFLYGEYIFLCSKDFYKTMQNYEVLDFFSITFKNNLFDSVKNYLITLYENLQQYRDNATKIFNFDGIFIPYCQTNNGSLSILCEENVFTFSMGGQICLLIYSYLAYSGDKEFIQKCGYEITKEIGLFYKSLFNINGIKGSIESPFGISPFSKVKNTGHFIASNCVTDLVEAKFVFFVNNKFSLMLQNEEDSFMWEDLISKIPDYSIGNDGFIKEYNSNIFLTNEESPFISYLFPYNKGFKIFSSTRDLEALIVNTTRNKFNKAIGNFTAHNLFEIANTFFSCGECKDGFQVLLVLIRNFLSKGLLFSYFEKNSMGVGGYDKIEFLKNNDNIISSLRLNIMFSNCIQNLMVNSFGNSIFLFNNIPNILYRGRFTNISINKDIKADIDFNLKRGWIRLKLLSQVTTSVNIYFPSLFKRIKGVSLENFNSQENCLKGVELYQHKELKIKIIL